jgi:hypothetical protein
MKGKSRFMVKGIEFMVITEGEPPVIKERKWHDYKSKANGMFKPVRERPARPRRGRGA